MVLLDAVSDFVGFLEVALVILVIKEAIGLLKGGSEGGGGGWNMGKLLGGAGDRPGNAAVATAEDQAARQEEERQRRQEATEMAQERREIADLRAVQGLAKRELTDYDGIRKDNEKLIGILQRMQSERRVNPELVEEIRQTVGHIQPSAADVRNVEQMLRTRIADLDAVERAELGNAATMWQSTQREITDITKGNVKGWVGVPGKGPNPKKLATAKQKFQKDAAARAQDQLNQTRKTLETHAGAIGRLEQVFAMNFNAAITALATNNIGQAIVRLEAARDELKRIEAGLKVLGNNDVNRIGQDVRRKLQDLQAETKLNFLSEIGVTRQAKAARVAAAGQGKLRSAAGGMRKAGGFLVRGIGRITKIRRGP